MHFSTKNTLKNNHNPTSKHAIYISLNYVIFLYFFSVLFYLVSFTMLESQKNSSNEEEWKQRKTKSKGAQTALICTTT